MKILILYERITRELEVALLIKNLLETNNHTCMVSHFLEARNFNFTQTNQYDCIIVPHLYNSDSVYRNITRFGKTKQILNLQYEQVLSDKWEKLGHHNPKGLALKGHHICWGTATKERLVLAGLSPENALLIGAPQLDFLRPEYIEDSNNLKEQLALKFELNKSKDWVLFLSSFTYAEISSQRLKLNESVAGIDLSDIVPFYTDSRKILITWFSDYLEKNSDVEFIYRPHPDELNLNIVKELDAKFKNFHIISYSSAKEWIIASDQLYTWYSTTVVEAQFIDKDCAILRPFDLPESFDSVLLKHGNFISTKDVFLRSRKSDFPKPISEEIMQSYYKKTETPASQNIVNFINNIDSYNELNINISIKNRLINYFKLLVISFVFAFKGLIHKNVAKRDLGSNQGFFTRWSIEMNTNIASKDLINDIDNAIKKRLKV